MVFLLEISLQHLPPPGWRPSHCIDQLQHHASDSNDFTPWVSRAARAARSDIIITSLLEAPEKGLHMLHHLWNTWDGFVLVHIEATFGHTLAPENKCTLLFFNLGSNNPTSSWMILHVSPWHRATQRYQGRPSPTWGVTRACQGSHWWTRRWHLGHDPMARWSALATPCHPAGMGFTCFQTFGKLGHGHSWPFMGT